MAVFAPDDLKRAALRALALSLLLGVALALVGRGEGWARVVTLSACAGALAAEFALFEAWHRRRPSTRRQLAIALLACAATLATLFGGAAEHLYLLALLGQGYAGAVNTLADSVGLVWRNAAYVFAVGTLIAIPLVGVLFARLRGWGYSAQVTTGGLALVSLGAPAAIYLCVDSTFDTGARVHWIDLFSYFPTITLPVVGAIAARVLDALETKLLGERGDESSEDESEDPSAAPREELPREDRRVWSALALVALLIGGATYAWIESDPRKALVRVAWLDPDRVRVTLETPVLGPARGQAFEVRDCLVIERQAGSSLTMRFSAPPQPEGERVHERSGLRAQQTRTYRLQERSSRITLRGRLTFANGRERDFEISLPQGDESWETPVYASY